MKQSRYHYSRNGVGWAVYKTEPERPGATKVSEHFNKEEARAEVYRLNGWKMPVKA